jgi:hypothetical protein
VRLSRPVSGALTNATLGNGVLVLAMPMATAGAASTRRNLPRAG